MPLAIEVFPGQRFGCLAIVREIGGLPRKFECVCDCGKATEKYLSNLRNSGSRGQTKSCGCIRTAATITRNTSHGMSRCPEHKVWCGMRRRCNDPKCKSYPDYGGRGISVCQRWESFADFYRDMGPRPTRHHSIERSESGGNYEPDNCRWATRKEQNRNTRANRFVAIGGVRKCIAEWDEQFSQAGNIKSGQFKTAYYRYGIERAVDLATRGQR